MHPQLARTSPQFLPTNVFGMIDEALSRSSSSTTKAAAIRALTALTAAGEVDGWTTLDAVDARSDFYLIIVLIAHTQD